MNYVDQRAYAGMAGLAGSGSGPVPTQEHKETIQGHLNFICGTLAECEKYLLQINALVHGAVPELNDPLSKEVNVPNISTTVMTIRNQAIRIREELSKHSQEIA